VVVDDERLIRWSLVEFLRQRGFVGVEAESADEAIRHAHDADVMILDYRLPDRSGFEVLRELRSSKPTLPVIMLTAHSSIEHAVLAMKLGAFHYVAKPFDLVQMLALVEEAIGHGARPTALARLTVASIIGQSPAIQEVRKQISRAAASSSPVLVTGESGAGKYVAARAIHGESGRTNGPFVAMSCASIAAEQIATELFGRERTEGARHVGLVELAQGGTLLVNDVDALSLEMQRALLAMHREKSFRRAGGAETVPCDVRIIAASSADLLLAIRSGAFLEELYDEVAVTTIRMPPLRERREDIRPLALHFIEELGAELDHAPRVLPAALDSLVERAWPGNVRELKATIDRALHGSSDELGASAFEPAAATAHNDFQLPTAGLDMEALERQLLLQALERARGNQRVAGAMLGMNRDQVRYRMAKFGIPSRRRREP
jgi:two-component system response regulator AtoC